MKYLIKLTDMTGIFFNSFRDPGRESITEKYRPERRVSRLAHEHCTTELSKPIQFCY